jgi:hypothetical protein
MIVSNILLLEQRIPKGIPIIIQKITAVKIIARVVMLSDQRSTRSIKIKPIVVKIVNLKPLVLYAKYANIKTAIGNGIILNKDSSPLRTESIGAESFLKSGRCINNHSLIFFSIHSAMGK